MCLTAVMALSVMSIGAFANENVTPNEEVIVWNVEDNPSIAPRVSYNKPSTAYPYSLTTPFTDSFWNVNSSVNTGKSDYYFYPNGSGQLKVWSYWDIALTGDPGATIKMYVKNVDNNSIGATVTLDSDGYGNYYLNKTISGIPSGTKIYFEFEVLNGSANATMTGTYTVSW